VSGILCFFHTVQKSGNKSKMKKQIGTLLLLLVALTSRADLTNLTVTTPTLDSAVPDGNPVGLVSTVNVSGMSGVTASITVQLDITGGFNGDLYAYLLSPQGSLVVLLNRVGVGSGNTFGYGDTGFNITLDSALTRSIHDYQSPSIGLYPSALNGDGQITGTWAPDTRTIDPQSVPSAFDPAGTGTSLADLNSLNPNGNWTLFIADLSAGGDSTLVSWGLTVVTVPEPQTWTLLGVGLAVVWFMTRKRRASLPPVR
jgi:subtilisin-like proprotein convertase family protein